MENEIETIVQPPKRGTASRIFRVLRRLVIWLFALVLLIGGAGFIIVYCYQDEVKGYVIAELNKQLNTQVIVDGKDIDFTVIRNFPYASVDFRNVKALDAIEGSNDTLFRASEISLQFNIVDVFHKNYHIRKVTLSNAKLRIRIDKNGNDNFHFWKESKDSSASSFSFALEKIILDHVEISYIDKQARQSLEGTIISSRLSGQFSNTQYSLETTGDFYIEKMRSDSTVYLKKKNVHAEMAVQVDNAIQSYKISSGKIKLEGLLFELTGSVLSANDEQILNLGIKGKDMDIRSVLSLIPEKYKRDIDNYASEGEFYFDGTIRGSISKGHNAMITADFGMRNASITQLRENITLKNVNLKGHYTNGNAETKQVSSLQLQSFSAMINEGKIKGDLRMENLKAPSFSGHLEAGTTLTELQKFWKADTVETISGGIDLNVSFDCDGKTFHSGKYENLKMEGTLALKDANLKLKNDSINGNFKFDNNDIAIEDFSGKVSSSDFSLQGSFRNIMGYILKENEDLTIEARLHSEMVDLNEILANKETDGTAESRYKLKFSEHVNVNLNSEISHLVFRKFEAANIKGVIRLKDKKLIADPVTLSTMNGTITTSGMVDGTDSTKLLVTCFSEVNRINVSKMFAQFENFGQSNITEKNIKGVMTAKINFISVLSPELTMDMDKLYSAVDMTIENGELNNVESMKSLSRFIELKELESVKFATLKNQIEIRNQVVNIPKMEVRSSAINITASGTHTFRNEINYKVKLSLNELMSKKAKKAKKENDEFGEVADDGLGRTNIFLSMTGTVENPVIRYDSKSAIQNVKDDIKVEKQNLKSILKDEFGLFKKDSTLANKNNIKKEDAAKFRINWEESDKKEEKKELKKPKKEDDDDY
jgi:hypothetical protein